MNEKLLREILQEQKKQTKLLQAIESSKEQRIPSENIVISAESIKKITDFN